ncbi:MAG: carbohydrate ABC transporter permease [Streptosporangiaceae bacterium]
MSRAVRQRAGRAGFYALMALFVLVSLFPFYWIVISSLKTQREFDAGTSSLLPGHVTWANYVSAVRFGLLHPLLNSAIVAGSTTILTVIIASLAGYGLSRTQIRGKPLILGFVLIVNFFPVIALVGPLFIAYQKIHLLNTLPALVISSLILTLPLATWLLTSYFSQIPQSLEEAALMDGSTRLYALRKIIVPVAMPGVFTAAILSFMLAWNDFTFAVSFLNNGTQTAPLAVVDIGQQTQFQTVYGLIDASVVIISVPIALLVIFAQRRIITGLTAGSFR